MIGRFVAIITPFMVSVVTSALTAAWKWLHGWQQHEQNAAAGLVPPVKSASAAAPTS
jgi:hypothetical protein